MDEREKLAHELQRLKALIKDAEGRMPAHSAKPVMMQRIFELEEARDAVVQKLKALS